ncbi:hypothetical protein ACLOJK_005937 [Asimina triloba]
MVEPFLIERRTVKTKHTVFEPRQQLPSRLQMLTDSAALFNLCVRCIESVRFPARASSPSLSPLSASLSPPFLMLLSLPSLSLYVADCKVVLGATAARDLRVERLGDSLFDDGQDSLDDVYAALAVVEVLGGELAGEDVKDDDAETIEVGFEGEMAVLEASVGWTRGKKPKSAHGGRVSSFFIKEAEKPKSPEKEKMTITSAVRIAEQKHLVKDGTILSNVPDNIISTSAATSSPVQGLFKALFQEITLLKYTPNQMNIRKCSINTLMVTNSLNPSGHDRELALWLKPIPANEPLGIYLDKSPEAYKTQIYAASLTAAAAQVEFHTPAIILATVDQFMLFRK